jgi:hypothetical protein
MRWLVTGIYLTRPRPAPMAAHPAGADGLRDGRGGRGGRGNAGPAEPGGPGPRTSRRHRWRRVAWW